MDYKRVNNDVNGNPRYVFDFLYFITPLEQVNNNIDLQYQIALKRAKLIGGKRYRGKYFSCGIVLQSFNIADTIKKINELLK